MERDAGGYDMRIFAADNIAKTPADNRKLFYARSSSYWSLPDDLNPIFFR